MSAPLRNAPRLLAALLLALASSAGLATNARAQASNVSEAVRAGAGEQREKQDKAPPTSVSPPEPPFEWNAELKLSGRSPDYFGSASAALDLRAKNIARPDDWAHASHQRSLDYEHDRQASDYTSGAYHFPIGAAWSELGGDTGYYAVPFANSTGGESVYSGTYRSLYGSAGRTLKRGENASWSYGAQLTWKDSTAAFNGAELRNADTRRAILAANLGYTRRGKNNTWWTRAIVSQGQSWFGAPEDASQLPASAPRSQTTWLRLESSYWTWFPVSGRWITLATQLRAQTAHEPLYGSEKLTIAGRDGVRGYSPYGGDSGVFLKQSVSHTLKFGKAQSYELIPSAALEAGQGWDAARRPKPPPDTLLGGTLALDLKNNRWSLHADLSDTLFTDKDNGLDADTRISVEARWRF